MPDVYAFAAFEAEARKHHMSYGQYKSAVDSGQLPAPDIIVAEPALTGRVKTCVICGRNFVAKSPNAITCSSACRGVRYKEVQKIKNKRWRDQKKKNAAQEAATSKTADRK